MSLGVLREICFSASGLVKRSVTLALAREAAVDASETGLRGRELRSGGESLGGGDFMTAVRVWLGSTLRFGLYRCAPGDAGLLRGLWPKDRELARLRSLPAGDFREGTEGPMSDARRVRGTGMRDGARREGSEGAPSTSVPLLLERSWRGAIFCQRANQSVMETHFGDVWSRSLWMSCYSCLTFANAVSVFRSRRRRRR